MKKLKFLTVLIALLFSVAAFSFTSCGNNTDGDSGSNNENIDDGNTDDGNTGEDKEPQGVEMFGLAEEIASINIVTADGQVVTGDENNQE